MMKKQTKKKCHCLENCNCQNLDQGCLDLTKSEENFAQMLLLAADAIFGNGKNSPILNPKKVCYQTASKKLRNAERLK